MARKPRNSNTYLPRPRGARIDLGRVRDPSERTRLWSQIQDEAPELADFIQSDTYARMRQGLGANVILTLDEAGHILQEQDQCRRDSD